MGVSGGGDSRTDDLAAPSLAVRSDDRGTHAGNPPGESEETGQLYTHPHESQHAKTRRPRSKTHPIGPRTVKWSRPTLLIGGVVGGTSLAALTGHASAWATAREGVADPLDLLAVLVGAVLLTFIPTWAVARRRLGRRPPLDSVVPPAAVLTAALTLFGISQLPLYPPLPAQGIAEEPDSTIIGVRLESDWVGPAVRRRAEAAGLGAVLPAPDHATFVRYLLIVLLVSAVAAVAAIARSRRQPESVGTPPVLPAFDDGERARAHGAVLVTIDAMLEATDPRTAIIGAYARLLEELDATGAARFDYEGPQEHLRRILTRLAVQPEPLETLIALFEEARFSEHALTLRHRDAALRALETVAAGLASPATSGVE